MKMFTVFAMIIAALLGLTAAVQSSTAQQMRQRAVQAERAFVDLRNLSPFPVPVSQSREIDSELETKVAYRIVGTIPEFNIALVQDKNGTLTQTQNKTILTMRVGAYFRVLRNTLGNSVDQKDNGHDVIQKISDEDIEFWKAQHFWIDIGSDE